jgi:hypothetical protein
MYTVPYSRKFTTGYYPEPLNPGHTIPSYFPKKYSLTVTNHLGLGIPSGLFPSGILQNFICISYLCKGRAVHIHAMKEYRGSRSIVPLILKLALN